MSDLSKKIERRMVTLEHYMNNNIHLQQPDLVDFHLLSITKFWSVIGEDDREYIEACRYALDKKLVWKK